MFKPILRILSVISIAIGICASERPVRPEYPVGVFSLQGRRDYMEDTYDILEKNGVCGFGVYDGHGGAGVANFLTQHLLATVIENVIAAEGAETPERRIENGFLAVDRQLLNNPSYTVQNVGSCALAAIVCNKILYVANVGDSRAVLGAVDGTLRALSKDHKADPAVNSKECDRICAAGGSISGRRVNGELAVTRAFGDRSLSAAGVLALPEVTAHALTGFDLFLILATDGVWDVMSKPTAVGIVRKEIEEGRGAGAGAHALVHEASVKRRSEDNATAIVIDLTR